MKLYRLEKSDGFFGLSVKLKIEQNKEMENFCKTTMEYFNHKDSSLVREDIYLQYMYFICSAILSICFTEYSEGKSPTEKQLLDRLEERELICYDELIILQIPTIPLLCNIRFDLVSSLKENNTIRGNYVI